MKRPDISESVNKYGYCDQSLEITDVTRNCLDYLVSLGYVEKKEDTLYRIECSYVVHPYRPFVLPFKGVVINKVTQHYTENLILNSEEYSFFRESANMFKNQMAAGNHIHISSFDYSDFSYTSDVYEVYDKYFDAILLNRNPSNDILIVTLTEPFIRPSINSRKKKDWRPLRDIDPSLFLRGAGSIDSEVESFTLESRLRGYYYLQKGNLFSETESGYKRKRT